MTDVSSKVSTKPTLYFEDVEIIACSIFDPTMMYIAGQNSIVYQQTLFSDSIKKDSLENDNLEEKSASTISEFQPRKWIPSRKLIKLMTRQVQIGVSAIGGVVSALDGWDDVDPSRRGLFIGASPQTMQSDIDDALQHSFVDGAFSLEAFAKEGVRHIHPLWLVKGLSNNILGFSSAFWDCQGVNSNYCHGILGGKIALEESIWALYENRCDIALVGASDDVRQAETFLGKKGNESAAFFALQRKKGGRISLDQREVDEMVEQRGIFGASTWPLALAKKWIKEQR